MRGFRTPVAMGGILAGLLLFVVAFVLGRADVAVTGGVLVTAVAIAWRRVPPAPPGILLTPLDRDAAEEDAGAPGPGPGPGPGPQTMRVRVDVSGPDAELVRVVATALSVDVHRIAVTGSSSILVRVPLVHSGIRHLLAVTGESVGADGVWATRPAEPGILRSATEPATRAVPFLPVPHALAGMSGAHEATRAGDGGEFLEIRPFASGDRLRRIDWKATARVGRAPGDLYVRKTYATSDATIAIVVDDGDDLSGLTGDWMTGDPLLDAPRSLDVAREAAWSLASAYLDAGDQVSLHVLSRAGGTVPRGSGARQRERLRAAIVQVAAGQRIGRERTPRVVPGALVVVLSTFLDDDVVRLVDLWRAAGHRVLAIDTLPRLRAERLTRELAAASRIVLGEREDRLRAVGASGADVLAWDAPAGERAAALRGFARARRRR